MTSSKPLQEQVNEWLRKQGYPLEMRVASALRKSGFSVRQSTYYLDPETGKSRETDIVCSYLEPHGMAEIHFVFECKGTAKPWILFTSEDALAFNRLFALGIFSDNARASLAANILKLPSSLPWFMKEGRTGYAITQAFNDSEDSTFGAVTTAIKGSLSLHSTPGRVKPPLIFTFPLVVTSSPLFECYLDGEGNTVLNRITAGFLNFDARIPDFPGTCVRIFSESGLDQLVNELMTMRDALKQIIADDVESEWKNFIEHRK